MSARLVGHVVCNVSFDSSMTDLLINCHILESQTRMRIKYVFIRESQGWSHKHRIAAQSHRLGERGSVAAGRRRACWRTEPLLLPRRAAPCQHLVSLVSAWKKHAKDTRIMDAHLLGLAHVVAGGIDLQGCGLAAADLDLWRLMTGKQMRCGYDGKRWDYNKTRSRHDK